MSVAGTMVSASSVCDGRRSKFAHNQASSKRSMKRTSKKEAERLVPQTEVHTRPQRQRYACISFLIKLCVNMRSAGFLC